MSVEAAIVSILTSDATVSGIVSTRVWANIAAQNPTLPYIVYQQISGSRDATMGGSLNLANGRFQLSCFATTMEAARLLADKVRKLCNVYSGTAGGTTIQGMFLQGESDIPDLAVGIEARRTYGKRLDFSIHFEELEDLPTITDALAVNGNVTGTDFRASQSDGTLQYKSGGAGDWLPCTIYAWSDILIITTTNISVNDVVRVTNSDEEISNEFTVR